MDAVVAASIAPERTTAALIDLSALLGLLVTVVGIYGAVAESVAGRRAELGVRMALGATARDVLALVGRQSLRLIGAGLAIGLVGGWLSARAVAHLLYGSSAGDVTVYLVVLAILGACGTVAWFIPAWRATRVNPTSALQAE